MTASTAPRGIVANRWALVPVVLIAGTITFAAFAVRLAMNDRQANAVEPDYYRKAVAWDDWKRQQAQNGALGWVVTPSFEASPVDPRRPRLRLDVADKHAVPIEGATVRAQVVPIRDPDARIDVQLVADPAGGYVADVPLRVGGQWEARVEVDWKGKHYADRFRRQVQFAREAAEAGANP